MACERERPRHIAWFSLYLQGALRHSVNVDIVVATKQIDAVILGQIHFKYWKSATRICVIFLF